MSTNEQSRNSVQQNNEIGETDFSDSYLTKLMAEANKPPETITNGKINYAKHNSFLYGPKKIFTPPEGWLNEAQAIELSGIDVEDFDWMIRAIEPGRVSQGLRSENFISQWWVEFYKLDPQWAVSQVFKRFISSPKASGKQLEHDMDQMFASAMYGPSKKQLDTLAKLSEHRLLTPSERWLLELFVSDGRISKQEISDLFDHFFGISVWNGSKFERWGGGVLRQRERAQKKKAAN
jgi:hypothetical protein